MRGKSRRLSPPAMAAADATARLEDLHLAQIFLRLPSPASVVRASVACRRWRRVAVSPAFLRQFRRLHPPQLAGFFICNGGYRVRHVGGERPVVEIYDPTFLPVAPPPRGFEGGAVACRRNFSLRRLPSIDHWTLADARDGLLLLSSTFSDDRMNIPSNFVVCDPLSCRSVLVQDAPTHELDDESAYLGAALVTVDDAGASAGGSSTTTVSFEVILVSYFMFGPRLCVFSSRTGQWSVLPEARCGNKSVMPMLGGVGDPAHANGRVYWVMDDDSEAYLMVLDTRTKEFSTVRLLASMCKQYDGNMRVMRTEDGELWIVAMLISGFALHFWRLDRSRSTKGRWVRERVVELAYFEGVMELFAGGHGGRIRIMDAGEGIVFLKNFSSWVFAVSIEGRRVLKLPHEEFSSGPALPYRMALSPPLPRQAQGQDGEASP